MKESGTAKLTGTLQGMMKSIADQPPQLDFGIINSDYSLTINTFRAPVPVDSYNVCRQLLYDPAEPLTITTEAGHHVHIHEVILPSKMRKLKPGDKVLVAIISNELVVIDKVYDSKWLTKGEPNWS